MILLQPKNTIGLLAALALVGAVMWGSVVALRPPMHNGTVEIRQIIDDPQTQVANR
jgi:hypothetical protein